MKEPAFNLLDEPWLPVRLSDGQVVQLGLLEVFRRSGKIASLAETAPPSLVAEYRLLLAIVHRAMSHTMPDGWKDRDRAAWYREGLPVEAICGYLERWRERFWMFHPEHPFMQVAALASADETMNKSKPWTQIALASASGNTPVIFDHAWDDLPRAISPADAIAMLLGFLQFTPGGLVKAIRDSDNAGPLANTAAVIPVGANLAHTLVLCLHPAPGRRAEDDLPTWERAPLTMANLRGDPVVASGPNDRYTRQSRAVLALREDDGAIRWLRFAAGLALADDPNAPDPMASFRVGRKGMVRLTFSEGRALWRDLPALVPNPAGGSQPAAVLSHAIALHDQLNPFEPVNQSLLVAGLASHHAKLLLWRVERIILPIALLEEAGKALELRDLVGRADTLFDDLRGLAINMVAQTLPDPNSKDTRNRASSLLDAGSFAASYFATAERVLPELLCLVGEGSIERANVVWGEALRCSARAAWDRLLTGMGRSPRALRADALFLSRFYGLLNKHLPKPEASPVAVKEA